MTSHKSKRAAKDKRSDNKRGNGRDAASVKPAPRNILTIDVGGRNVKLLATGHHEPVKIRSGKTMTPSRLVTAVQRATKKWKFDAISIGYPGLVRHDGPHSEPLNLGPGWVGFDFAAAFGKPVRIINDAAMQAIGSYNGGRMLFIGLGTGLGSALITENVVVPVELGELPVRRERTARHGGRPQRSQTPGQEKMACRRQRHAELVRPCIRGRLHRSRRRQCQAVQATAWRRSPRPQPDGISRRLPLVERRRRHHPHAKRAAGRAGASERRMARCMRRTAAR